MSCTVCFNSESIRHIHIGTEMIIIKMKPGNLKSNTFTIRSRSYCSSYRLRHNLAARAPTLKNRPIGFCNTS
jgi:hypothetical protein